MQRERHMRIALALIYDKKKRIEKREKKKMKLFTVYARKVHNNERVAKVIMFNVR